MQTYRDDAEAVVALSETYRRLKQEIGRRIIGQETVVERLLMAVFSRGHALLVGVPGLAKTLLVQTVADVLDLSFKRIQFTPDLMPSDITGSEILDSDRRYRFVKGPLFAHLVLADEINRTPPKPQAALREP
ncbi:MAG: AAA family ATPase, partial [Bacteroidales bacterium]|nr:AAA family ATPase [Bacteroidales bacterium]